MLQSKVNIGELDREIIILRPLYATGANRPSTNEDKITGWEELATVWGKIENFSGNEAMIAERLTETHHIKATVRHRTDIEIDMRIVTEGRVYSIVSINDTDSRRIMKSLTCELLDNEVWS